MIIMIIKGEEQVIIKMIIKVIIKGEENQRKATIKTMTIDHHYVGIKIVTLIRKMFSVYTLCTLNKCKYKCTPCVHLQLFTFTHFPKLFVFF